MSFITKQQSSRVIHKIVKTVPIKSELTASKKSQKLQLSEAEAMGKKTVGRKRKGKTQKDAFDAHKH